MTPPDAAHLLRRPSAELPDFVGPYRVLRPCPRREGEALACVVWDPAAQRHAVLQASGAATGTERAAWTELLRADVAASARVGHPGVIRAFDVGEHDAVGPYLVREFVHGPSLRALPTEDLDLEAALCMLIQAAHALSAADAAGVAPRPVRLEDLFVTRDGQVKVSVLGRPHLAPPAPATRTSDLARAGLELLTGQNTFPREPRIPSILDKGLQGAFVRMLGPASRRVELELIRFVQVLVAEAPLDDEIRSQLLDLSDRSGPIVADARVAAWARSVWRHDEPYLTIVTDEGDRQAAGEVLLAEPVGDPGDDLDVVLGEPTAVHELAAGPRAASPARPAHRHLG